MNIGPEHPQSLAERNPRHLRHVPIGEKQVDPARLFRETDGSRAGASRNYVEAHTFEYCDNERADLFNVIDNKDSFEFPARIGQRLTFGQKNRG